MIFETGWVCWCARIGGFSPNLLYLFTSFLMKWRAVLDFLVFNFPCLVWLRGPTKQPLNVQAGQKITRAYSVTRWNGCKLYNPVWWDYWYKNICFRWTSFLFPIQVMRSKTFMRFRAAEQIWSVVDLIYPTANYFPYKLRETANSL